MIVFACICDVLPRTPLLPVRIWHLGFGRVDVIIDAVDSILAVVVAVVHVGLRRRQLQVVLLGRVCGFAEVEVRRLALTILAQRSQGPLSQSASMVWTLLRCLLVLRLQQTYVVESVILRHGCNFAVSDGRFGVLLEVLEVDGATRRCLVHFLETDLAVVAPLRS